MASCPGSASTSKSKPRPRKRRANVFDAVKGRVTHAGLIGHSKHSNTARRPLRPDEVLFKRKNAPVRYQEDDYYHASTKLPADQPLPPGELSSAIHAYVSHLYAKTAGSHKRPVWKSMDGTALIAMSILMEETARSVLGETGDLALTEADQEGEDQIRRRRKKWTMSAHKSQMNSGDEQHRPAREMEQSIEEVRGVGYDSWTWSDEGSAYTTDDTHETIEID